MKVSVIGGGVTIKLVLFLYTVTFLSSFAFGIFPPKNDLDPIFNFTDGSANVSAISRKPTRSPTNRPTKIPLSLYSSRKPSSSIPVSTSKPMTFAPTILPFNTKSKLPTNGPSTSRLPSSLYPSFRPSKVLSSQNPTSKPIARTPTLLTTKVPSLIPTVSPTVIPSKIPSNSPVTSIPSTPKPSKTQLPSKSPTKLPTHCPSSIPSSLYPSFRPSIVSSSRNPTRKNAPSSTQVPSKVPTKALTVAPSLAPSNLPVSSNPTTTKPSVNPTRRPTRRPTIRRPTKRPTSKRPTKRPTSRPSSEPIMISSANPSSSPTTESTVGFRYWLLDDLYTARSCDFLCGLLSTLVTVVCSADMRRFSWPHSAAALSGIYSGPNVTSRVSTLGGGFDRVPFPFQPQFIVSDDTSGPQPFPFYCANSKTFAYSVTTRAGSCNATVLNSQAAAAGCTNSKRAGRICPCLSPVSLR